MPRCTQGINLAHSGLPVPQALFRAIAGSVACAPTRVQIPWSCLGKAVWRIGVLSCCENRLHWKFERLTVSRMTLKRLKLPTHLTYPVTITDVHFRPDEAVEKGDPLYTLQDARGKFGMMRAPFAGAITEGPVPKGAYFAQAVPVVGLSSVAASDTRPRGARGATSTAPRTEAPDASGPSPDASAGPGDAPNASSERQASPGLGAAVMTLLLGVVMVSAAVVPMRFLVPLDFNMMIIVGMGVIFATLLLFFLTLDRLFASHSKIGIFAALVIAPTIGMALLTAPKDVMTTTMDEIALIWATQNKTAVTARQTGGVEMFGSPKRSGDATAARVDANEIESDSFFGHLRSSE